MTELSPVAERLNFAKLIAHDAGRILMRLFGHLSGYDHKGKIDLVSEADRRSDDYLVGRIRERFPGDSILAEESGRCDGSSEYTWIIDPLDGTTNFVHSHPAFAVSIAVVSPRGTDAGVIYLPATRELFFAAVGEGAVGPAGPLHCSPVATMANGLAATGFPYNRRELLPALLEDVSRLLMNCQGFRRLGSACIDLAYVAAGRIDCYLERNLKPWDTAAGALLVSEAGGRVSDFSGRPFDPFGNQLLATNGKLHEQALEILFGDRPDGR